MTTLDGTFIRNRRIEHNLSVTIAADFLGVRRLVLQRIEANDAAAVRQVTVTGLLHLAKSLGCQPQDFFTVDADDDGDAPSETAIADAVEPTSAASVLSGFLLAKRVQVSVRDIASALDWTRKEVHAAKDALPPLLKGTGIRLAVRADMLQLVPDQYATIDKAVQSDSKSKTDRRGINDGVARVLRRVVDGSLGPSGNHSVFTRSAIATLTNLGALDIQTGAPAPSAALLHALDLKPHQR